MTEKEFQEKWKISKVKLLKMAPYIEGAKQCPNCKKWEFPDNATAIYIPDSAFKWFTNIQTVLFDGDSKTTRIGRLAFWECANLTSVSIPASVLEINYSAFEHCKKLTKVFYHGTEAEWNKVYIDRCVYTNYLETATKYYFQESAPTTSGNFWCYDEVGQIKIWD